MIIYIADFNLPNTSAYSQHVLKMCDALKLYDKELYLIIPYKDKSLNFKKIKNDYLLKRNFKIKNFTNFKVNNKIFKIIFFLSTLFFLKNKNYKKNLIITRIPLLSLLMSIAGIKNVLEIHQDFHGISKLLFNIFFYFKLHKNIKFILIHKNLKKIFKFNKKHNCLVLDDGVDVSDFKNSKSKYVKKDCVYTGSLSQGKGFEIILELAKRMPKIKFRVYGDKRLLDKKFLFENFPKNLIFKGHVKFKFIPKILESAKILLLPYGKKVYGRSKGTNLVNYMSPLKLFEYLASGSAIIASKLVVYNHILKNNYNSLLVPNDNIEKWMKSINTLYNNKKKIIKITKKNKDFSKNFNWSGRAKKIINFYNEK
tara:strand:+ start:3685 stop:4788 length:1104 start_codon:yes stop_codon:yes gene_type:complete